ncbi:hypothetical protein ACTACK_10460 [Pseudomonas syringae]|uniref:hypothetical protein n=1 Tax=Pseudomonas syringae TaxID=317 RepID=UPI003F7540C5
MNLSHKRIAEIRKLVSAGIQLGRTEAEDMLGHNDHLTELCEARARLVLRAESESETLRGLYQMHKQTETREMRDLKAELAGLKTGYEAYDRVNADWRAEVGRLKSENEKLRKSLCNVMAEVDGNIRETVRDCVNGLDDVQDIYGYCDSIEAIVDAALSMEQSHD